MEYIRSFYHTPDAAQLSSQVYLTWVGYRECLPSHTIGPRILSNYKAVLTVKGSGFFVHNHKNIPIRAGDMFFLFPQVRHHYFANPSDPWSIKWISFNGTQCGDIISALGVSPERPILRSIMTREIDEAMDGVIDSLSKNDRFVLAAMGYFYLFLDEVMRAQSSTRTKAEEPFKQHLMQKILTFIELNYANEINIDLLCGHVNYSRSYISHFFKRNMGISLPEYLNRFRVQKAKTLLLKTDLKILEVAKSVGYGNAFYFSQLFKRYAGIPPQAYREEKQDAEQI